MYKDDDEDGMLTIGWKPYDSPEAEFETVVEPGLHLSSFIHLIYL